MPIVESVMRELVDHVAVPGDEYVQFGIVTSPVLYELHFELQFLGAPYAAAGEYMTVAVATGKGVNESRHYLVDGTEPSGLFSGVIPFTCLQAAPEDTTYPFVTILHAVTGASPNFDAKFVITKVMSPHEIEIFP